MFVWFDHVTESQPATARCDIKVSKQVSNEGIAVRKVTTRLRELTRHMGSRSVTCHPTEVIFLPLPEQVGTRFSDPGAELYDPIQPNTTNKI